MKLFILNYIKSAQFVALILSFLFWTFTFFCFKASGLIVAICLILSGISTLLIPFCSTKPEKVYIADELKKLSNLKDEGVLDEEEFDRAKNKLIK